MNEILSYFHIPFCDSKCHYCAFNSYTSLHSLKKSYMNSALKQLKYELNLHVKKKRFISSLFIGGGTPSTVKAEDFEDFFKTITPYLTKNAEITIEANPNSATIEWLYEMREFGVNRISFGVQSFFDEKLKLLGRKHTAKEAKEAILNAKKIGFKNISLDYMYATALDTAKSVKQELEIALSLPVNHISAYSLTIEENTPFYSTPHVQNDDENIAQMVAKILNENSLTQYEVSNYGLACKHNLGYWEHKPYLGIGAGAVGFLNGIRYYPKKDIKEYIADPLFTCKEKLSKKDIFIEKLFLGLRSKIGVKKSIFNKKYHQKLDILLSENKIYEKNGSYFCKDFFIADEVVLFLIG